MAPEAFIFQLPQYECSIIVAFTEVVCDPAGIVSAGYSVRYHDDVMTTLKSDCSNLSLLLSV